MPMYAMENDNLDKNDDNSRENLGRSSHYISYTVVNSCGQVKLSPLSKLTKDEVLERWQTLSGFERTVFKRYTLGQSLTLIMQECGTSQSTISRALQRAKGKLGIKSTNRYEILAIARLCMNMSLPFDTLREVSWWLYRNDYKNLWSMLQPQIDRLWKERANERRKQTAQSNDR